ncbi:MAG TPA: hypothetical protein VMR23_13615 [Candidatus Limnocylindria bacterium]|nr:hypothetical protein [Candidatus Limnocylindria bacterium]
MAKVLVLEVTFFEDAAEGLRESVAALAPGRKDRRADIDVHRISADAARQLLTWPMLTILRAIRRRRPQSITALANAVDRDAAGVKADLTMLEQLGVIAPCATPAARAAPGSRTPSTSRSSSASRSDPVR